MLTNTAVWRLRQRPLRDAHAAAEQAEQFGIEPDAAGRLLNEVGLYLQIRAEYAQAKLVLERAVGIGEQHLSLEHSTVAIRMNNLGLVLQDLGDLLGETGVQAAVGDLQKIPRGRASAHAGSAT